MFRSAAEAGAPQNAISDSPKQSDLAKRRQLTSYRFSRSARKGEARVDPLLRSCGLAALATRLARPSSRRSAVQPFLAAAVAARAARNRL